MNEDAKAAAEKIWNVLKQEIDLLATRITALYGAAGSTRSCRHINELWHPDKAGVGIGFVPPEARDQLETLIAASGIRLHKGQGPLGKSVYFSLLYDERLTTERLADLGARVEKETQALKAAPPVPKKAAPSLDYVGEALVDRVEGYSVARGDKLRSRPAEVAGVVDAFNGATIGMTPLQVVQYLKLAIPYLDALPDISRRELLRTLEMMEKAEGGA